MSEKLDLDAMEKRLRERRAVAFSEIRAMIARIRELEPPTPFQTDPCPGMNCGCTDGVSHSPECRAETAATYAGGWFVKGLEKPEGARPVAVVREDHDGTKHAVLRDESLADGTLLVAASAVEDMIAACVPGGSICDPQVVADAIRGYFAARPAPATGDEAWTAISAEVGSEMNNALCDFARRWVVDGDYLRCKKCKRPHIASKAHIEFVHADGCKNSLIAESHPWRSLVSIVSPLMQASAAHRREDHRGTETLRFGARVLQLYDDATMASDDHMIDATEAESILIALADYVNRFGVSAMQRTAAPAHGEDADSA